MCYEKTSIQYLSIYLSFSLSTSLPHCDCIAQRGHSLSLSIYFSWSFSTYSLKIYLMPVISWNIYIITTFWHFTKILVLSRKCNCTNLKNPLGVEYIKSTRKKRKYRATWFSYKRLNINQQSINLLN